MSRHTFSRWLPYAPEHIFAIVADVARYGEFVPLCQGARVWDERREGAVRNFRAELRIAYPKLRLEEYFVSDVTADAGRLSVLAVSREGAVRELENRWLFTPRRGGTDIRFALDFHMSSRMLQMVMNATFDYAMNKILTAFEQRARALAEKPA